ncbi:hypothetical protein E5288_WYG005998 [Bos mutus]|uniref:Uncharacterized protein n=1 Tax=Bos mutus TaxID=72004 RepID=A0A6B0QWE3_9CETA|nr:hypothetical protein [Bos mutus]
MRGAALARARAAVGTKDALLTRVRDRLFISVLVPAKPFRTLKSPPPPAKECEWRVYKQRVRPWHGSVSQMSALENIEIKRNLTYESFGSGQYSGLEKEEMEP